MTTARSLGSHASRRPARSLLKAARRALAAFVCACMFASEVEAQDLAPRAARLDRVIDAFVSIQDFGLVRASPDGAYVVVEVTRPRTSLARTGEAPWMTLSDLWLVDLASGETRQLTSGARTGDAAWEPIWSPDSRRIAYLTNAGDGAPRAAWMDVRTRRGGLLSERGVDIEVNFGSRSPFGAERRVWGAWMGDHRFMLAASAPGEVVALARTMAPDLLAAPRWAQRRAGQAAITVWDSASNSQCSANTSLLSLEVGARSRTRELFVGAVRAVSLAPDQTQAALVLATGALAPPAVSVLDPEMIYHNLDPRVHTRLDVLRLDGRATSAISTDVMEARFQSSDDAPRWSRDSSAIFAPTRPAMPEPRRSYCVDAIQSDGQRPEAWRIECARVQSRAHARLLAFSLSSAPPLSSEDLDARIDQTARVLRVGEMTLGDEASVFSLGGDLVGVVGANTIRLVELRTGQVIDEMAREALSVLVSGAPMSGARIAVLSAAGAPHLLRVMQGRLDLQAVDAPAASIAPAGIVAQGDAVIWTAEDAQGKSLFVSDGSGGNWRLLMRLERPFPADLALERRAIHYTAPDGSDAVAILLLPPNYDAQRAYPLILNPYPGQIFTDESIATQFDPISVYNVDAYALAHMGYVVARPSMPYFQGNHVDYEALSYFSGLIENFAEETVRRGLTEPGRIGLWGHSNGGYLGLGVAGRTHLIDAIVSSSPFPDVIQVAELPAPMFDVDACAPNRLYGASAAFAEDPDGPLWRMGGPTHAALDRFLRNSPLYHLGPQTPPVLIMQGQFDSRGTADSERVYTRLNRQNVPVQLARYWGEGHNFLIAESIRDRVHRAVDWYGVHLVNAPHDDRDSQ